MPASERQQREVAERRERVLSKRASGLTYAQIADSEPTLSTASAAVQDAKRALVARARERTVEGDPVALELERLEALERAAQTIMRQALTGGANPQLALKAIDRLTSISQKRSALLGLTGRGFAGQQQGASRTSELDEVAQQRRKRRAAQGW